MLRFAVVAALAAAFAAPSFAQSGRPVQTETVIAPEGDRAMPAIPDEDETPVADDGTVESRFGPVVVPEVFYDPAGLPTPVRRLREQIIEAAATGDPDRLRPIIDASPMPPAFSFGHVPDPIAYLMSLSGDPEGREILAILIEVLEAGYVHVDAGTPEEMYVWPYFARYPVEALTAEQIVELFKLVYAGDYEDMKAYGYYLSYRLGIAPDGTWHYFIAGE